MPGPQFCTIERALKAKCKQRKIEKKYIRPSQNESHAETRKRRRKIRESIESTTERKLRLDHDAEKRLLKRIAEGGDPCPQFPTIERTLKAKCKQQKIEKKYIIPSKNELTCQNKQTEEKNKGKY